MTTSESTSVLSWSRPAFWWVASAATLAAGYADLWRGGETMAPILLVIAYCILVPIAILK